MKKTLLLLNKAFLIILGIGLTVGAYPTVAFEDFSIFGVLACCIGFPLGTILATANVVDLFTLLFKSPSIENVMKKSNAAPNNPYRAAAPMLAEEDIKPIHPLQEVMNKLEKLAWTLEHHVYGDRSIGSFNTGNFTLWNWGLTHKDSDGHTISIDVPETWVELMYNELRKKHKKEQARLKEERKKQQMIIAIEEVRKLYEEKVNKNED